MRDTQDTGEADDRCRPQRVLVVDEHELIQAGLRSVLLEQPWVGACFGATSAEVAWAVTRRHHPQIALISASLSGTSAIDLCRELTTYAPYLKVVLMSGARPLPARLAAASGAVGLVSKQLPAAAIAAAVRGVAHGARAFARESNPSDQRLSARELEVVRHLAAGLSNPEVAVSMQLSPWTVKQHASVVYRKLGVRNRAQAVSRALELGLVWPARSA